MDTCAEEECGFPRVTTLPSLGFRCPDSAYDACETECADQYDEDQEACGDPNDPANAECHAQALGDWLTCSYQCMAAAVPAWLTCLQAEVTADKNCCNTTLGDCDADCETAMLVALQASEVAYFQCGAACSGSESGLLNCRATKIIAQAGIIGTRSECRATCERAEIERHAPEERKRRECGGRYHECRGGCSADFIRDGSVCLQEYALCRAPCLNDAPELQDDCLTACRGDYLTCITPVRIANLQCRVDCCVQEYSPARHGFEYSQCYVDCHTDRIEAETDCELDFYECVGTDEECSDERTTCRTNAETLFDTCVGGCNKSEADCPACHKEAIEGADKLTEDYYESSGGLIDDVGLE